MNVREGNAGARLPDFIVIGAAKSGTTTLDAWLRRHPGVFMARNEPGYFAGKFDHGLDWYTSQFARAGRDDLVGETTPRYTRSSHADIAAARMSSLLPGIKLVYVVRQPIERLVSDYRHLWRLAQLREPFLDVVTTPDNPIVGASSYYSRLRPYIDAYPRERICVERFEDVVDERGEGWYRILDHLGLPHGPRIGDARNVTEDLRQVAPGMVGLGRLRRRLGLPTPPRWASKIGRRLSKATQREYHDPFDGDVPALPGSVSDALWDEVAQLEAWLGVNAPLWERT